MTEADVEDARFRAALLQFDCGLSRDRAEREAVMQLRWRLSKSDADGLLDILRRDDVPDEAQQ